MKEEKIMDGAASIEDMLNGNYIMAPPYPANTSLYGATRCTKSVELIKRDVKE